MPKPIQGKQYTVVSGDTLWTIATRAYGNPAKWSKIYRANASTLKSKNADLIYPGEILYIPPETEIQAAKQDAKASRFASREKGTFNLVIGNREVPVTAGRFKYGIDLLAFSWTGALPWMPGEDPELDKLIKRYSYSTSELYLGPTLVGTGKLYGKKPHVTKSGITVDLEFFSSTADIVDSTMTPPYEYGGETLKQIASGLCGDLGYEVDFSASTGSAFDYVSAEKTETIGAFLQRLAVQRGMLCSTDERSRIRFLKAISSGKPVAHFKQGEPPWEAFDSDFDGRKRFAVYRVVGQSGDADDIVSVAKDSSVKGHRQLTYTAGDVDTAGVKNSAEWRRSKALADALSQPITAPDWYDDNGNLWAPNTLITEEASALDLPDETKMLIRSVELSIDKEGGRRATLDVVPPFTLTGGAPEAPWI